MNLGDGLTSVTLPPWRRDFLAILIAAAIPV
ncbi:hypothetical protein H4W81_004062 [Nonomuraea africana]|uniref:Uncharacterized protein n=1 Tax=Nonomuraea africana TaxID=46171 RepID=A0ABR9KI02_9ACTN|nr:hypothetical protein [Nonomuraea africana]